MPRGIGTYGSKVGRPPKKKKIYAREGILVNPKKDKKIDRGLKKAALKKSSDFTKKILKKLKDKKKKSAQDPSEIKKKK